MHETEQKEEAGAAPQLQWKGVEEDVSIHVLHFLFSFI